jgi:hypothetical protein
VTDQPNTTSRLPFRRIWPTIAGAIVGVGLRLAYSGHPDGLYAAMSSAFVYLAPMVVGAVTVYVAELQKRRSWGYYFTAPFIANVFFVVGTMLIMVEGLICAVVIVPMFAMVGAVGGLIMGGVCRFTNHPNRSISGFIALPLLLGGFSGHEPPARYVDIERSILIAAKPDRVWKTLLNAPTIEPREIGPAWIYRVGVPKPLTGVTTPLEDGAIRRVTMGKNIYFDEVLTDVREPEFVRWTYRFYADSFPDGALDEHVVIGGKYFDVIDTAYRLTPQGASTVLAVRIRYRVSTTFNWYAYPASRFLMGDLAESNLAYYRGRAEQLTR